MSNSKNGRADLIKRALLRLQNRGEIEQVASQAVMLEEIYGSRPPGFCSNMRESRYNDMVQEAKKQVGTEIERMQEEATSGK